MSSSSSYCISKEPCTEPLCFKTRSILGSMESNLLENLDESTRCSSTVEDVSSSFIELKRFTDIMRPKEQTKRLSVSEYENISMEPDGRDSILMGDTTSTLPITSSLPVTPALTTTAPVSAPIVREAPDLLSDKTYDDVRRGSRSSQIPLLYSNRASSLSTSSSSSAMKLKSLVLKNNQDGAGNSKGNAGRLTVLCRRLDECAHFHYEVVELKSIELSLAEDNFDDDSSDKWLAVEVVSKEKQWRIKKTFQSLHHIDEQLHNCIFKRKFSRLPELTENLVEEEGPVRSRGKICTYFDRLSTLPVSRINCGPILSWMEMDNRGNRVILPDSESAINIPAVAAAHSIRAYTAQSADELSLKVGDILSIIDKPPSNESNWWRGKKEFEVGFFPADCVELLDTNKIPQSIASKYAVNTQLKHTSSIGRRNKLKSLLMSFFSTRPNRSSLKRTGIVKERLFACDLGEHLLNSSEEVPAILKCCAEVLEVHGIVDGIYRLSGAALTIHKLRNEFDEGRTPVLTSESYEQDIHSISSLLKMYFRELPNPLLTYQLYDKFIEAITETDEQLRPFKICDVVKQLPPPHYRTAEYLFRHLNRMASHDDITSMHCKNLSIVWAPNLLRSKELEQMKCGTAALKGVSIQAVVTEYLIKNVHVIFNEENQNSEDGISTADFSKMKVCTLMSATPRLLTLEEAQERKSNQVSSHLNQQKFLEVGVGPVAVPPKYHTVINITKDKKKSPSRLKQLFRRSRSTSFKEDSNEGGKSSASTRDKKASSVRVEKLQEKSKNTEEEKEGEKRNLSTSALLCNKAAAGNASFGILDDFKRLSTSCDIPHFPADTPVNRTTSGVKKFKSKHRSTSVDIASTEVNCLLDSMQVVQNCNTATQHPKSLKRKSNGQKTSNSPLVIRQSHNCPSANDYVVIEDKKSQKSKSQKRNNLLNKPPRHVSNKKKSISDEYEFIYRDGQSALTDGNQTMDEEQLDKPILASDESDFRSDSLETFEVIPSVKSLLDDVLSSGKSEVCAKKSSCPIDTSLQSSTESSESPKIDKPEKETSDKEIKNANSNQMQLSNISNDLMGWSLSSDVTSKDLYKELSPTINNIWMESGWYTSGLSGTKSFNPNSQTAPELNAVQGADVTSSESPQDGYKSGNADDIVIPSVSVETSNPTGSGNDFLNTTSIKSSTIEELTDEDLRNSYSNFDTALNILEQSCNDSKLKQDKVDDDHDSQALSKSESDEISDQVFAPSTYVTSFDRINPKRNSIHCCLEIVPEKKSTYKSTPSINEEPPSSELSEAALDLFSFNRMYSSGSLGEAKLQINNEDGYVSTSYKNLSVGHSEKPNLQTLPKDVPIASAPVMSNKDEDILRKLVSCTSCTESFGNRTVMMPVGSAAKKLDSESSSQTNSVRNTAPPSELYPQRKESYSSSKGRYSTSAQPLSTLFQASTDPLKRKESLVSYPNVSDPHDESFADKKDFLFRSSGEKNSAFKHHHHRNSARYNNTDQLELYGNASVRLTSREMKMYYDHHLALQQKQQTFDGWKSCSESKHAKPEGRNSCQPSVIILNKPSSDKMSRLSTPCYGAPRNCSAAGSPKSQNTPKSLKSDQFFQKMSASHTATSTPHLDNSRNSLPAASTVVKNLSSSQVPFVRSISQSEEDDEFLLQTSKSKRRITSQNSNNDQLFQSAVRSFSRPDERKEKLNSNTSALRKAAQSPNRSVPAQRFDSLALKSSQQIVQPASTKSSAPRANQTFVTAKKQLFENNGNC